MFLGLGLNYEVCFCWCYAFVGFGAPNRKSLSLSPESKPYANLEFNSNDSMKTAYGIHCGLFCGLSSFPARLPFGSYSNKPDTSNPKPLTLNAYTLKPRGSGVGV